MKETKPTPKALSHTIFAALLTKVVDTSNKIKQNNIFVYRQQNGACNNNSYV